jgi:hypothetical protein
MFISDRIFDMSVLISAMNTAPICIWFPEAIQTVQRIYYILVCLVCRFYLIMFKFHLLLPSF